MKPIMCLYLALKKEWNTSQWIDMMSMSITFQSKTVTSWEVHKAESLQEANTFQRQHLTLVHILHMLHPLNTITQGVVDMVTDIYDLYEF